MWLATSALLALKTHGTQTLVLLGTQSSQIGATNNKNTNKSNNNLRTQIAVKRPLFVGLNTGLATRRLSWRQAGSLLFTLDNGTASRRGLAEF